MLAARSERARTWCATTTWGSARWQRVVAAVITAVIFWPQAAVDATVGREPSWQVALALARIQHLAWGPEIVFTYGPLGFLRTTAYYSFDQTVLATVYQLAVIAALFLGIAAALRLRTAPMTALLGAFLATGIAAVLQVSHANAAGMMYPELAVLAALAWAAVPTLQAEPKRSTVFTICLGLGVVAGLALLVKFTTGLTVVAIALAVSVLLDWKAVGRHCATAAVFLASAPIWWVLAGQPLGNLPTWLRNSAAVVSGYNEAQAVPLPPEAIPAVVLSLAWMVALCAMFVRGGPQLPRRFVLLIGIATVITAKTAFARYDLWHFSMLLGMIVVSVTITPLAEARNRAIVVAAVLVVFAYVGGVPAIHDYTAAAARAPVQAIDRLATLALPGHVAQHIEQAKARQRAHYAIPNRFVDTIGSRTVHIDPEDTSAAWAYNLAWRPAPVFATYSAYTPELDRLNSDSLIHRTEFVLSRLSEASPAKALNGRLGVQESPRYSRALLCNYTVSGVENRWVLLTRTSPRCGALRALSEVDISDNKVITVPRPSGPDMAVLVGIDLRPTVVDRLFQGTIASLTTFTVVLDGVVYRLIAANAAEPFLIHTPASAEGTNLEIDAHTIGVGRTRTLGQGPVHARLRFFEMRVEPIRLPR